MYNFSEDPQITDMENLSFYSFLNIFYACAGRARAYRIGSGGNDGCGGTEAKIRTRGGVRLPDDRENAFPVRPEAEGR